LKKYCKRLREKCYFILSTDKVKETYWETIETLLEKGIISTAETEEGDCINSCYQYILTGSLDGVKFEKELIK